jgi:hypothetical protein
LCDAIRLTTLQTERSVGKDLGGRKMTGPHQRLKAEGIAFLHETVADPDDSVWRG